MEYCFILHIGSDEGPSIKHMLNIIYCVVIAFTILWIRQLLNILHTLPNLQEILSALFSIIYMVILTSNCFTILVTMLDHTLQKPMDFFPGKFFLSGISYVSVTVPRILLKIWTQDRNISVLSCVG